MSISGCRVGPQVGRADLSGGQILAEVRSHGRYLLGVGFDVAQDSQAAARPERLAAARVRANRVDGQDFGGGRRY